jgi:hypothetical protein
MHTQFLVGRFVDYYLLVGFEVLTAVNYDGSCPWNVTRDAVR